MAKNVRFEPVGEGAARLRVGVEQGGGDLRRSVVIRGLEGDDSSPVGTLGRALGARKARRVVREQAIGVRITTL